MKLYYDKKYWEAVAVMVGYIVGVGIFGLPFLTVKAGVGALFFYLVGLGLVQYLVHSIYANLVCVTPDFHRLPGYAGIYLGPWAKRAVFLAKLLGNYGALLAYIIISGQFLFELLSPVFGGTEFFYASAIYLLEILVVFMGVGMIAGFELYLSGLLAAVVLLIAARGAPFMSPENLAPLWDWKYFLLPYGAMLFALEGNGAIPLIGRILKRDKDRMKSVIALSMFAAAGITLFFSLAVVAISGPATAENALLGIKEFMGSGVYSLALFFGLICVATSVLGVAEATREILAWDFRVPRRLAWFLAVSVPYFLYALGFTDFLGVIGFAGAVTGGLCAIIVVSIVFRLRKMPGKLAYFKKIPAPWLLSMLIAMFAAGVIYNIIVYLF